MAWLMDVNSTPRSPIFTFDYRGTPSQSNFPEVNGRRFQFGVRYEGLPYSPFVATQIKHKNFCDAFNIIGYRCFSDKVRQIIEEFEPGLHQFFPVELQAKDRTPYTDKYFIFNACTTIDAVLDSAHLIGPNEPRWHTKSDGSPRFWMGPFLRAFSSREIGDRHIWTGGFMGARSLYVSNALKRRLDKEKVRYLTFRELEERDVDWRPEEQMRLVMRWLEADPLRMRNMVETQPDWVRRHRPQWMQ